MQGRSHLPYTTPLAAPPPPLNLLSANQGRGNTNLPALAGARHTLGPTFSEEEDGDDSQFIAEKIALLGLAGSNVSRGTRRHENDRRAYTPPSEGSRRSRRRQFEQGVHDPLHHLGGRDQNISPPMPHGHGRNANQSSRQTQQQEAYVSLQYQAQLALMAAHVHQQQQDGMAKTQNQYHHSPQHRNQPKQHTTLQQQQQNQNLTLQQQQQALFALSQQALPQNYASPSDQREQLAAQVQANLLARTRRQQNLDDAETRARFESIPNTNPTASLRSLFGVENSARVSPFDSMWSASTTTQAQGDRFTSALAPPARTQATPVTQQQQQHLPKPTPSANSLSALLSRRSQTPIASEIEKEIVKTEVSSVAASRVPSTTTTAQASPVLVTTPKEDEEEMKPAPELNGLKSLGLGRPKTHVSNLSMNRPLRAWSTPTGATSTTTIVPTPRSVSQPATALHPVRQPYGPPGNIDRLKEENFKSLLRKRAGLKLGMLNRRVSPILPSATLEEE